MSIDIEYDGNKNGRAQWIVNDISNADIGAIINEIIDSLGIDETMISITISVPEYVMNEDRLGINIAKSCEDKTNYTPIAGGPITKDFV